MHKVDSRDPFWTRGKTSGQINVPTPLVVLFVVVVLGFFAYEELQPQIDAVLDWIENAVEWVKGRPR